MIKLTDQSEEVMFYNEMQAEDNKAGLLRRSRDIFHKGELIGNVMIAVSPFRSEKIKMELLKVSFAALLIAVVVLFLFTGFLLKKFLKEPMDLLGQIAGSYPKGDYHPQLDKISYKEFEPLVSALVDMGETIESQMNELQKNENILKKHSDNLEKMVARRTRELENSNKDLLSEIRERRQAQKEVRDNEKRLEAILRASPVGIGLVINRQLN